MINPATQGCESLMSCSPGHGKPWPIPPHTHCHQSRWHLCSGYNTLLMASSRPCPSGCGVQPWGDLSGDRWSPEPTAQCCSLIIFTRSLRLCPASDQAGLNKSLIPQGTCRQWKHQRCQRKHQRCQLTPHPTAPPDPWPPSLPQLLPFFLPWVWIPPHTILLGPSLSPQGRGHLFCPVHGEVGSRFFLWSTLEKVRLFPHHCSALPRASQGRNTMAGSLPDE